MAPLSRKRKTSSAAACGLAGRFGNGGPHPTTIRRYTMSLSALSRRDWLRLTQFGAIGWSLSGWLENLAGAAAAAPARKRACILLWMNGGPSTIDLWDLKPGHANGGPYKEIATSAP